MLFTMQTLLSILRHKTVEKSLERCEMSIVEGVEGGAAGEEEQVEDQSAESKLVIRLHCKYGTFGSDNFPVHHMLTHGV